MKTIHRRLHTAHFLFLLFACLVTRQVNATSPPLNQADTAPTCITKGCHTELQEEFLVHPKEFVCTDCHTGDFKNHDQLEVRLNFFPRMCMECHENVIEHKILHAPVAEGDCKSCHDPHTNPDTFLLRNNYPVQFYVDYTKDTYGLCFTCHKPELLMHPETAFSTDFRNGIQNLHYLHVNKEKRGRNCSVCHNIHGSEKPKLMANTIQFGSWQMEINFQISEKGGSCAPGCHRPRKYDRDEH
jgi:predicted CXXCH cytochrome family protein